MSLRQGPVDVEMDGADLRVRPIAADDLDEVDGLPVIPTREGETITDEDVRSLRNADQNWRDARRWRRALA